MIRFKGFETKEAAQKFIKEHGGVLTYAYTPNGNKSMSYQDYMLAVTLGGLDEKRYPFCVQWNV